MKETLKAIQRRLAKNLYTTLEQMRFSMVSSLLTELGWDTGNPEEVRVLLAGEDCPKDVFGLALTATPDAGPHGVIEIRPSNLLGKEFIPNGRPPARIYVLTDGRMWRIYFHETGRPTPDQCVRMLDLLQQTDLSEAEQLFRTFLGRESLRTGAAVTALEQKASALQSRKWDPLRKALPKARQLSEAPPHPPLEKVLLAMMVKTGFTLTMNDVVQFLQSLRSDTATAHTDDTAAAGNEVSPIIRPDGAMVESVPFEYREWIDTVTGMVFVWIPPGSFMMGSPDDEVGRFPNEGPVHQVTVSGFWLARHPVTFGQWRTVMDVGAARSMAPSRPKTKEEEQREATQAAVLAAKADYPVEDVLWPQAQEFIQKLCLLGGIEARMRLPTEAEWEYAARAGETGRFPGDGNGRDRLDDYAWYSSNSTGKLQRIGKKKPNAWGLHDMLGNVWEWALDGYGAYSAGPVTDPQGNADASEHARRGGSYRSNNKACRFARRNPVPVDELEVKNSGGIGFRVARDGP